MTRARRELMDSMVFFCYYYINKREIIIILININGLAYNILFRASSSGSTSVLGHFEYTKVLQPGPTNFFKAHRGRNFTPGQVFLGFFWLYYLFNICFKNSITLLPENLPKLLLMKHSENFRVNT